MKRLPLIFSILLWSCTSDESAIKKFNDCLSLDQQRALTELENLSNKFIKLNYPQNALEEGYGLFLDDLEVNDKVFRLADSASVIKTNRNLKEAFGEFYDESRANFLPWSNLNACLKKASNSPYVDQFLIDKMNAGEIGPGIIGGGLNRNRTNPAEGLPKIIFLTEVAFRKLYLETIR